MIFLQLLYDKKASDAQLLLWYIIHEGNQDIFSILKKYIILPQNKSSNPIEKLLKNKESKYKIYLDILSKNKNFNNLKNKIYVNLSKNNISNFFDINFLLKQLKILKILLKELITSKEKKEALYKILKSIDILIDTCNETFEYIKKANANANAKDFLEFNNLLESMNLDKLNNVNRQKYLKNFNIKYEKLSENKKKLYTNNYIEKSMLLSKLRNNNLL